MTDEFQKLAIRVIREGSRDNLRHFLLTYRRFGTSKQLFTVCLEQYRIEDEKNRKRFADFIQEWIGKYYMADFSSQKVSIWLACVEKDDQELQNTFKLAFLRGGKEKHRSFLLDGSPRLSQRSSTPREATTPREISDLSSSSFSSYPVDLKDYAEYNFLEINSATLAEIITMREFQAFCLVTPLELTNKIGWPIEKVAECPGINKIIHMFHQLSLWVATEIVSKESESDKIKCLEKIIDTGKECERLNNFNAVLEIVSGLSNPSVLRLKSVWNGISPSHSKAFSELEDLMDPKQNFKKYRSQLLKAKLPALPYFGLFLKDLTFLKENPDFCPDGSINFDSLTMVAKLIEEVIQYQNVPYRFEAKRHSMQAFNFFEHLRYIEDHNELFKLSMKSDFPDVKLVRSDSGNVEDVPQLAVSAT